MTAKTRQRTATACSVKKSKLAPDMSGASNTDFFCTTLTCSSNDRFSRSIDSIYQNIKQEKQHLQGRITYKWKLKKIWVQITASANNPRKSDKKLAPLFRAGIHIP
jgi:hypothetical protein